MQEAVGAAVWVPAAQARLEAAVGALMLIRDLLRQVVTQLQTRVAVVVADLAMTLQLAAMVVQVALALLFSVT
jgi:hypothetical protein